MDKLAHVLLWWVVGRGWTWMDVLGLGRTHRVGDSEEREEAEHVASVEVS